MARKKAIKVSLDPDQLDHAEWYLKTFDNCNTLQDVIRMFLDQYPDALIQRVAQQKESIRMQMMEVAEVLHVPAHHSEIMRLTRQNIEQINELLEQVKQLRGNLENCHKLLMKAHKAAGSKEGVPFGEVIDDIAALRSKYEAIENLLKDVSDTTPLSYYEKQGGEIPAVNMISAIITQKRKLRSEIDEVADYFGCAQNGGAILYEAKERLKTIASKLGVPDTVDHIVDGIVELNKQSLVINNLNANLELAEETLKEIGKALDMPRDGVPIEVDNILERIEYNRKDIKQKAQALDANRHFTEQIKGVIGIIDNETLTFDEIVDRLRNRLHAHGCFSQEIRKALKFDDPQSRTCNTVVGELNHQLFLKSERERERDFYQRQANRPLRVIAWERIKNWFRPVVEVNNGTEKEG